MLGGLALARARGTVGCEQGLLDDSKTCMSDQVPNYATLDLFRRPNITLFVMLYICFRGWLFSPITNVGRL